MLELVRCEVQEAVQAANNQDGGSGGGSGHDSGSQGEASSVSGGNNQGDRGGINDQGGRIVSTSSQAGSGMVTQRSCDTASGAAGGAAGMCYVSATWGVTYQLGR